MRALLADVWWVRRDPKTRKVYYINKVRYVGHFAFVSQFVILFYLSGFPLLPSPYPLSLASPFVPHPLCLTHPPTVHAQDVVAIAARCSSSQRPVRLQEEGGTQPGAWVVIVSEAGAQWVVQGVGTRDEG